MIDPVCSRALAPSGDNPAAIVKRSAGLLSWDKARSLGTDGGPCLSISVTVVSALTLPGPPCHKHVRLILGLMGASLEDHGGSALWLPEHWTWL